MNERYDTIRERAGGNQQLELLYDGSVWLAQIPTSEHRWAVGEGVTPDMALADLERTLGIPKWTG